MGLGGISIWQLLIILAIVVMLFGTKRLRNIGGDLGAAIKGFRNSMNADDEKKVNEENHDEALNNIDTDTSTSAEKTDNDK